MKQIVHYCVVIVLALIPLTLQAAPKAKLWEKWADHDPNSTQVIDHGAFDAFLKQAVVARSDGINRVIYPHGRDFWKCLDGYVAGMKAVAISRFSRAQQFAYWVNLYNALTLRVVRDNSPVKSIRDIDISPGLFSDGPWGKKLVEVEGEPLSLDDIEHRILRPIWKDPRIHYVVNCASVGCPNLQADAFTAENTEALLDKAAREYINHPRGARFEGEGLMVSSLYNWYAEDFGGSDEKIIEHLKIYAQNHLAAMLENTTRIDDDEYDWAINAIAGLVMQGEFPGCR